MEGFLFVVAYVFLAPIAAKTAILDAKLDPEGGEDETRVLVVRGKQLKPEEKKRLSRSFCRRWLRAANYRRENIERAIEGKPVDNCPRLTRAKRNLWRSLKDDHTRSTERMKVWRDTGDNLQKELDMQTARREIEAELNFHANVTIDDIECERPIIAADGEGADDLVNFIPRDGIDWPDHHTILLGAGGVGFTKDGKVLDLPTVWAGHEDKRGLGGIEAIEFYLNLPDLYGKTSAFVLLKGLRQGRSKNWHYERVWEICKRQDFDTKKVRNNTIYIGTYAISYIKSKVLIIHKLDPNERDDEGRQLVLKRVTIYDVFGFYQTSFVQVVSSLVPLGLATEEEVERMRQNKARRSDFNSPEWPLERIKAYTIEELRKLSTAVTVLRRAAADDGIRLNRLDGAGNLSAGEMRKHKVMRHYKGLMVKYNAGVHQLRGYHADFGGRIELIQQGSGKGIVVYKADEKSSYPHKCVPLPSMIGGFWIERGHGAFDWADIEEASPVSLFQVRWCLPERYIDAHGRMQVVPFYALPYRLEGKGIRFFSRGWGWFYRDDVVLLKRWLETFAELGAFVHEDGSPWRLSKAEAGRIGAIHRFYLVDLIEANLFCPANGKHPFAFVPAEFEKRKLIEAENKRTKQYNIAEKVIKLKLNGLSGKVAQSIGGSETKPPSCYNVHYAGATRRSIGEAALQAPHETVQFCTDAVFSKVPLTLNEGKELGQWEVEEVRDLLTVQSGVYSYLERETDAAFKARMEAWCAAGGADSGEPEPKREDKIENKTRGFSAGSVANMNDADLEAIANRLELEGVPGQEAQDGVVQGGASRQGT